MHNDLPQQVTAAYQLALGREPRPAEAVAIGGYAKQFGLEAACRVIFNSNEFVFVD
jgi:hypothetical protein